MPIRVAFVGLGLVPALRADGRGRDGGLPPTVRRPCIGGPAVCLAAPGGPRPPLQFRVPSTLRGSLRPGETIAPGGLSAKQVQTSDEPNVAGGKPRPRGVASVLLFLEPGEAGKGWKLLPA